MRNLRKYGNPPFAVAAVHGGPGATGEMAAVARELSSNIGVLEPLQTATTIYGQIEELRAILEIHGSPPLTLIGFSWGAWLSVILTASYPKYVNKLILISSGPFEEKYAANIMKTRLQRLQKGERKEMEALYKALCSSTFPNSNSLARFGQLVSKIDSYDPLPNESHSPPVDPEIYRRVWDEASKLRSGGQLLELAGQIECPVMAIHGDYDPHPAEGVRDPLSRAIRDFRFVLLGKCGHYPWRERNTRDAFYRLLRVEISGPVMERQTLQ
jgi:pimeloyl-ACP methyl ester carboxylesterase